MFAIIIAGISIKINMAMEPILMASDEVSHAIRMDVLNMASQWMNSPSSFLFSPSERGFYVPLSYGKE